MELAQLAVKKAVEFGATEAEAYIVNNRTTQVAFAQEIQDLKTVNSTGLGLRVAIGKKLALYSTSILEESEVIKAAETAYKIAKIAPEDPHWNHFNTNYGLTNVSGVYDEEIVNMEYDTVIDTVSSAIKKALSVDERVKPTRGNLTLSVTKGVVTNSSGDMVEDKGTMVSTWLSVKARDAGKESTGSENYNARSWAPLDMEHLAEKAARKAVTYFGAKPIESGQIPVVLRNQNSANILNVMLSSPIMANVVQRGGSPLSDKLGDMIAAENITITDDGTYQGGMGTRMCDGEGCPTQVTPVIEAGVLKNFLFDSYTALREDVDSTGNASRRSYASPPAPSPSNLILRPGTTSHDEIIEDTKNGLYVDNIIGAQLSNTVSGNLNAVVTRGYVIENGELTTPVKNVVLAGNFYEVLKDGYEILGNDPRNSGSVYSPTVKLGKITVAGK